MDAKLHGVDADTGKRCAGFADNGILDINQWNTTNDKWPLSILQPPTVYKDTLFIGWAGKDWADSKAPPGRSSRSTPGPAAQMDVRRPACRRREVDRHGERLGYHVGRSGSTASSTCRSARRAPTIYGGNRKEKLPLATSVTALNADTGQSSGAVSWFTTTSGITTPIPPRF